MSLLLLLAGPTSTTYPAAGTVAGVSGVSGSATALLAASGTVAATSDASGATTLLAVSSGTVNAVSGVTGDVTLLAPAAGSVAAVSDTVGSATALLPAGGSVDGVSGLTGATTALLPASGTVAGTSASTGATTSLLPASGSVAGVSGLTGATTALLPAGGSVAGVSATSGAATIYSAGVITSRTATLVQSNTVQTLTGTLPTDRVTGDVTVAVYAGSTTVANLTSPSGWSVMVAPFVVSTDRCLAVWYKFDPASGPQITTTSAAGRHAIHCQSYGGVDTTTPVDVTASTATAGSSVATAPSITTVTANARLLSGILMDSSTATWTVPTGMTLYTQTSGGGGRASASAYETWVTAGATGTRLWTSNTGSLGTAVFLGALRPAPAGTAADTSMVMMSLF